MMMMMMCNDLDVHLKAD